MLLRVALGLAALAVLAGLILDLSGSAPRSAGSDQTPYKGAFPSPNLLLSVGSSCHQDSLPARRYSMLILPPCGLPLTSSRAAPSGPASPPNTTFVEPPTATQARVVAGARGSRCRGTVT